MADVVYTRPALINNYPKQRAFVDSKERTIIVEGATKTGKTVGCIVWLFEKALQGAAGDNYWWVAPIVPTSKIAFRRFKKYITKGFYKANESELTITLATGQIIWFKSADNPDSLYGDDVKDAVIDEATRVKRDAWPAIVSVLTATHGSCRIIGNTKGTKNWVYELKVSFLAGKLKNFAYFRLTADDAVEAGTLTREDVEQAEQTLPKGVFLELYYCIPNENSADKFCYSFSEADHVDRCEIDKTLPLYLSFDFNRNPICCSVIQWNPTKRTIRVLECIKLENSNIYRLCEVIKVKYPGVLFLVCGDATGRNMSALTKDKINYFDVIRTELGLSNAQMQQTTSNPTIEENQVLVNAIFEHYDILIDQDKAQALIFDCKFVEMDPSGDIKKTDRKDPKQQADALDTLRYWMNRYLRNFIKYKI